MRKRKKYIKKKDSWHLEECKWRKSIALTVWLSLAKMTMLTENTYMHKSVCMHMHIHAHMYTHAHTFVHANSDIMHGCPVRFIIKALSGCAGSEGENMNRIKQIVWCVKDRHSSSKVLKLLLPMDWLAMRIGARKECSSLLFSSPFLLIMRHFQTIASLFMQGPSVSVSNVN